MSASDSQPITYATNRYIVYREKSQYRIAPDSNLYIGCDIVAAGSAKAMEAVMNLMTAGTCGATGSCTGR